MRKENILFIFKYLWGGFIDIIFTFKVNIYHLLFMRFDNDIFYLNVLNFESCILYFVCFKELFGDIKLPYMLDTMSKCCNNKSQHWPWYLILGIGSQTYMVSLVVIILHNDVLWDLKIKQSFK